MPQESSSFFRQLPFFVKLIGAFLLVVTLPVGGLSFYNYTIEHRNATTEELTSLQGIAIRMADDIDKYIVTNHNLIRHMALNAELKNFLLSENTTSAQIDAFNQWLRIQSSISPEFSALYVLDTKGNCIASTEFSFIGQNYAVRYYFRAAMAGKVYQSDWSIGLTSGEPGIYLSAPIVDGATILGVVVLKMRVNRIVDIVNIWHYQGRDAFLLNEAGITLVHTRPQFVYHSLIPLSATEQATIDQGQQFADVPIRSLNLPRLKDTALRVMQNGQIEIVHYVFENRSKIAALNSLKEQPWVVGVAIPEEAIYARSNLILRDTLVFSLLSLIVSILVALLMSRLIARPILHLTEKVNQFAAGHTQVRAEVASSDEIGQLATSFNHMADTIHEHTRLLEDKVQERTRELESLNEQLQYLSIRDPLTGCYNRRYLNTHLEQELARVRRHCLRLALIMCDIDHFKHVNDVYGHLSGDSVLRDFGYLLQQGIRENIDWAVRYGGEEFLLVLPETNLDGATMLAERLRLTLAAHPFQVAGNREQEIYCTASFGVMAINGAELKGIVTADDLTKAVDHLLYCAKHAGRNRVITQEAGAETSYI